MGFRLGGYQADVQDDLRVRFAGFKVLVGLGVDLELPKTHKNIVLWVFR